jgi:hypothetical protein
MAAQVSAGRHHSSTTGVTLVALRGVRCRDSESSVDDLGTERGVVYGRAVATLRSVETQPLAWGIRLVG